MVCVECGILQTVSLCGRLMKNSTLQTLITARALFEQAETQASVGDRYLATAGLIVLQDAVELIILAVLLEKEVDEKVAVERFSFDDMIAELRKIGIKVPKSGKLRAMNKLRVTAKHYGEIMEPVTVLGHLEAAKDSMDSVLNSAIGKSLREIFLTELVGETPSRPYLDEAAKKLAEKDFRETLILARKAFHIEFERDYVVFGYRDGGDQPVGRSGGLSFNWEGYRAPEMTRSAQWIAQNVRSPRDYIQLDYDNWRIQAVEWGISTSVLSSILSMTPSVVRLEENWFIQFDAGADHPEFAREHAAQALDLVIDVIRRKHEHLRSARYARRGSSLALGEEYVGRPLFEKAWNGSHIIGEIRANSIARVFSITDGFMQPEKFYAIVDYSPSGVQHGYVECIPDAQLVRAEGY